MEKALLEAEFGDPPRVSKRNRMALRSPQSWLLLLGIIQVAALPASAQRLLLDDGRILEGKFAKTPGIIDKIVINTDPEAEGKALPIVVVDDGLRRTFVSKLRVAELLEQIPQQLVTIRMEQPVAVGSSMVGSIGPSLGITPLDKYGRRIYEMQTRDGPLAVIQGITELNHRFAKLESLKGSSRKVVWDMRLATSSIPKDQLRAILAQAVPRDNPDDWLQVVRFYLEGERYSDARQELKALLASFPERKQLEQQARQLRQLGARRVLREIELRHSAGQYALVSRLLNNFPTEEVSGETLQRVRELAREYEAGQNRVVRLAKQLKSIVEALPEAKSRALVDPVIEEIAANLSQGTVDRLVPFDQLYDDDSLSAEEKVALAISGWLLGGKNATQQFAEAVSLITIRAGVLKYLREPMAHERIRIMESVGTMKGASVENVAKLIAQLPPPLEVPSQGGDRFSTLQVTAKGRTEHGDFRYQVQLPPEYDPYRRYPTIVVLNGAYNSPEQEIDFWAGSLRKNAAGENVSPRNGQAMRHGYITIAVDWQKSQQFTYGYSLREHESVLTSLRDACRRFAIDTDRVYISGHGIGGEAAWDFAQAHPDLWAGAIPFVAVGKKYVHHYWKNLEHVPMYFIAGELDGNKMSENEQSLNQYLKKRFDVTLVEFHGRGHEPYHDEILRLFDWMSRQARSGPPKEFVCSTMRPWDNFFWWIEGREFPNPVYPQNWVKGARPTQVEAKLGRQNVLFARAASRQTTLWLAPEIVDFSQPITLTFNGKKLTSGRNLIEPQLEVLLEDVRTRADRLRPFWAKVEVP